jgi:hypothetical protein
MKIRTNSKDCSGSRIIIFVPGSPSAIGRFSPIFTHHWMQEKIRVNIHGLGGFRYKSGPQAGFFKRFQGQNCHFRASEEDY